MFLAWVGVALSFSVFASAWAETSIQDTAPYCWGGWWEERTDVPLTVENAPLMPTLLLPVQWGLDPSDAVLAGLTVLVRAPSGEVITGTLIHDATLFPQGLVRWRPAAPLTADTQYEVRLRVSEPPARIPEICGYRGFERILTLRVGDGAEVAASLTGLGVESALYPRGDWRVGNDVCDGEFYGRCANVPYVCCQFDQVGLQGRLTAKVTAPSHGRTESIYYLLEMTLSGLEGEPLRLTRGEIVLAETYQFSTQWLELPSEFNGARVCMSTSLTDVLAGRVVAAADHCGVTPLEYDPIPGPVVPVCPDYECPRPQAPPTPGTKPDVTDDTPDTSEESLADIEAPPEKSGCTGGSASELGLVALCVQVWLRRRARDLRA